MRMFQMISLLSGFHKDTRGATAIEYGLIAAGIAVAIAGVVGILGGDIAGVFTGLSEDLNPPPTGGGNN